MPSKMNNIFQSLQKLIRPDSRSPPASESSIISDDLQKTDANEVWLLGRNYESIRVIMEDVYSRFFLSYRFDFPSITQNDTDFLSISSDAGWGCMHRSGQMLLAQALSFLCLSRGYSTDFRIYSDVSFSNASERNAYFKILSYFMDLHSSPFSIQNLSINGVSQDRKMGEWFGPWALCTSIRSIWNERLASDSFLPSIKLVLSSDGTLVLKDISQDRPCLILLATRLGVTSINKNYYPTIKKILQKEYSCGIAGGKNNGSFYCIGYENDSLICLDPHIVQHAFIDLKDHLTCHTAAHFSSSLKETDPSLLIGFMLKDADDVKDFISFAAEIPLKEQIFNIQEANSSNNNMNAADLEEF